MPVQLIYRKPHKRRLKTGETVRIAGSWHVRETRSQTYRVSNFLHKCPVCGAQVRSVRMQNGGWGHFEAAGGLHSVKHPCFYLGDDMSRTRDQKTPDLFDHFLAGLAEKPLSSPVFA